MSDCASNLFNYIVTDVNLIIRNRDIFNISNTLNDIGLLFIEFLGDTNAVYPPDTAIFTVQYISSAAGKLPVTTTSAVGPDPSQQAYSMLPLLSYKNAFATLATTSSADPSYLLAVSNFIDSINELKRFFHVITYTPSPEFLQDDVPLYGGLIDPDTGDNGYSDLAGYLTVIAGIFTDYTNDLINLLEYDYSQLEIGSQGEGITALSRGLSYQTNKGSRIWNRICLNMCPPQ